MNKQHHIENHSENPLQFLQRYTHARVAQERSGVSLNTNEMLAFKLAHAHAKDAIHAPFESSQIQTSLKMLSVNSLIVSSEINQRKEYLTRPDKGRKLNPSSADAIKQIEQAFDLSIILADGLSPAGMNKHAIPLIKNLLPLLENENYTMAPIFIAENARVAIADEIGILTNATITIILIGERPGLSACESVGIYLTYQPTIGLTNERRNCLSNIHDDGMEHTTACGKLMYLIKESMRLKISGVQLKETLGIEEN